MEEKKQYKASDIDVDEETNRFNIGKQGSDKAEEIDEQQKDVNVTNSMKKQAVKMDRPPVTYDEKGNPMEEDRDTAEIGE